MLERRHPHITNILSTYAATVLPLIVLIIPFATPDENGEILFGIGWAIGIFAVLSAMILLFLFLGWRNTWIYTSEDTLYYERGVLAKNKRAIPFSKINTIDLRRNIFERIFGTAKMKIDTGAIADNSEEKAEMALVFTLDECEKLRSYILNRNSADNDIVREEGETLLAPREPDWSIKASFGDFFLYGLTDSSIAKIFLLLLTGIAFVGELTPQAYDWLVDKAKILFESFQGFISGKSFLILALLFVIVFVLVCIASSIFSIVYAAIRFWGFRAAREGDNIVIRYGLISLKSYTLPVENIHACVVSQNMLQQLLKRASVEIVSVGYGNEENETALLFPIIKKDRLSEMLHKLLPEYDIKLERKGTNKKSIVPLIVMPLVWWTVICAVILVWCGVVFENLILASIVAAVLTVLRVIAVVLDYKHSAIGIGDTAISVETGGLRYSSTIIRKDAVQSVTASSGPIRRKLGLRNYRIDYHAPVLKSIAVVTHLPEEYIDFIDIE